MFDFLRPYWLILILPVGFLLWFAYRRIEYGVIWSNICDEFLLKKLLVATRTMSKFPWVLLSLFLGLLILSLAGPSLREKKVPVLHSGETAIILLDLSEEMMAEDIEPNRLTRAKYKIDDLLSKYSERKFGLVVFSEEAFNVSPVTQDVATLKSLLPALSPMILPIKGRNLSNGLLQAYQLLIQGSQPRGNILLITTGKSDSNAEKIAKDLQQKNIKISVLAIGSTTGAPIPTANGFLKDKRNQIIMSQLDEKSLKRLAHAGGGRYQKLTYDESDVNNLGQYWITQKMEKEENVLAGLKYDDGYWLLFIIVPLALLAFRPGWYETICG